LELDDKRLEVRELEFRPVKGRIPVLITFLLGVLLIVLISAYTHYGQSTRQKYVTWTRLAVQIRSEATTGHLYLEEALMGSDDVTLEATREHWGNAQRNINLLLDGGELGEDRIPALIATDCREQSADVKRLLDELVNQCELRLEIGDLARAGTAYDNEFDLLYSEMDGNVAKLVSCLRAGIDHHSQVFEVTQVILTVILFLITGACLWLFAAFNRQIDKDIQTISATSEELNATNEELNSTVEELQATNEELEAQYAELTQTHDNLQTEQRERLELQSQFSQIVDTSPMGLFFYELQEDGDLVLLKTNAATNKILGVDCSQMVGLTIEEAFPPLARTEIPDRYRAAARDGETYYGEQVNYDDKVISGAYEVWAFQTEPMHMAVFFQDITERLRATEEVKALRQFLEDIIDSMPSALVTVDGQGNITQWNHSAEELTGRTTREMVGTVFTESIPALAGESGMINQVIHERETYTRRKLQLAFNGQPRLVDLTIYPLAHVDGAVIRLDDVTKRVRMEEMMIQSEKMLSVGGLAAGMAHEINNPLAGILQNSQVLEQRLSQELPPNVDAAAASGISLQQLNDYAQRRGLFKVIAAIRSSGEHATQIVKNMLSFSRKSDKSRSSVDLAKLVDETIELAWNDYDLKKNYDFRRITITREYGPGPLAVSCERTKIQQVILNLLKNGAEAMVETQRLRPPEFVIRLDRDTQGAWLVVEDNGPGITEEIRNRLFEPFFTTKTSNGGTGLGLSISYFIITENHNGTMEVESLPEGGCRFTIMLPWENGND